MIGPQIGCVDIEEFAARNLHRLYGAELQQNLYRGHRVGIGNDRRCEKRGDGPQHPVQSILGSGHRDRSTASPHRGLHAITQAPKSRGRHSEHVNGHEDEVLVPVDCECGKTRNRVCRPGR